MAQSLSTEQLKDVLTYPFKDPDWKRKLAIAFAIAFFSFVIPLVFPWIFLIGYCGRIQQRIIHQGDEPSLPEWTGWGELFMLGLKRFGAGLVFALPAQLLMISGYVVMIPLPVIAAFLEETGQVAPPVLAALAVLGTLAGMAVMAVGGLVGIVLGIVTPAALGHVSARETFSAAFRVREWWSIFRANLAGYLLAFVILLGLGFAAYIVASILYLTIVLCCLTPLVYSAAAVYLSLVSSALFATAYREGVQRLAGESVDL